MILPPKLFLLSLGAMLLLHWLAPVGTVLSFPFDLVGVAAIAAGLGAALWGSRRFRREPTEINTFGRPTVLITDGLFRISRNPIYVGLVIALLGVWALLGSLSPGLVALLFAAVVHNVYIPYEEGVLRERFGPGYAAYCATTRRWI